MALVVPNASVAIILQYITNNDAPENLVIRLYSNNFTPSETSTVVNFVEVTGGGYVQQNLISSSWTITTGVPSQTKHTEIRWTFTGATGTDGSVFGYYVVRATGGELMWAECFSKGPFKISVSGDEIKIVPRLTLE